MRGVLTQSRETLESMDESMRPLPERLSSPQNLRDINKQFTNNDLPNSENRARVQELVNFVPPWDPAELEKRGQGDRFNVNFGLVSSIVNEGMGAYVDIYSTPSVVLRIALERDYVAGQEEDGEHWATVMGEEFTTMLRSWDASMPNFLLLNNILITHGVAIPWFEDENNLFFNVGGMEDFKFDDDALAISSEIEATTISRSFSVVDLYAKIEDKAVDGEGFTADGWHVETVKRMIANAKPTDEDTDWNFQAAERQLKANRVTGGKNLPNVIMLWGIIQEMDGSYSVYGCPLICGEDEYAIGLENPNKEQWAYRRRSRYKDANEIFQIFTFGVGDKLNIHTIRGLAYFLYEAGQADNVIRCKALEAARFRSTDTFQPSGGIESEQDMQILDVGPFTIVPPSLKGATQPNNGQPLDRTIGVVMELNQQIMDRHSGGLASQSLLQNPAARRNELQVAAELDHLSKLLSYSINLYYPPYEKLMRELARRSFTATQTKLSAIKIVKRMKKRCIERGVPEEAFSKIDFESCVATRVLGAGSRGSRVAIFSQLSQMFPEMDPTGQEHFVYDWAVELAGQEKAKAYFGLPTERRTHVDVSLARLENARLREGDYLDPVDGENKMVHLEVHLTEGLEEELEGVVSGQVALDDYVLRNVTLHAHVTETLDQITVHESMIPKLKKMKQRVQQIGEVIENGMREIVARQREDQEAAQEEGVQGSEEDLKQVEHMAKLQRMAIESQAKVEMMIRQSEADIERKNRESMAKIAIMEAEKTATGRTLNRR